MGFDRGKSGGFRQGGFKSGGFRQGGSRPGGFRSEGGFDRKRMMARARAGVTAAMLKRDNVLVQTVSAVDEINKTANLLSERLQEWYGLYFPELKLPDQKKYAEVVIKLDKQNYDEAAIAELVGEAKAKEIGLKAAASMGVALSPIDHEEMKKLALELKRLYDLRDELEEYEKKVATELCPNISLLCEPALAAKLVAQAGSLERLSLMPASTVQVLGAEKALFKHLKSGSPPPKHGLIFQHALISTSPKKARGKIARALATNIAIAVKADAISKNFIAVKLKERFEKRAKEVLGRKEA